jgi:hypothetical protein
LRPQLELKPILSKKATITRTNNATFLQPLQASPQLGLRKSIASEEPPDAARSTTLLTQSPVKAGLSHAKSSPPVVDYKSVLTKFYQVNSPDKVAEVDQALQKYHVSEVLLSFHFCVLTNQHRPPLINFFTF